MYGMWVMYFIHINNFVCALLSVCYECLLCCACYADYGRTPCVVCMCVVSVCMYLIYARKHVRYAMCVPLVVSNVCMLCMLV